MTCTEYQEYKRKAPGLIARVGSMVKNTWSFTVTTVVEAWNIDGLRRRNLEQIQNVGGMDFCNDDVGR